MCSMEYAWLREPIPLRCRRSGLTNVSAPSSCDQTWKCTAATHGMWLPEPSTRTFGVTIPRRHSAKCPALLSHSSPGDCQV